MSDGQEILGQVSRHGGEQHRPGAARPADGEVPDVLEPDPLHLGGSRACRSPVRPGRRWASIMVPPIGAGVWVEFEHGDPNHPIWVGCRWGAQSDIPFASARREIPFDPNIVIQSLLQHAIVISDMPPSVPPPVMPPLRRPVASSCAVQPARQSWSTTLAFSYPMGKALDHDDRDRP